MIKGVVCISIPDAHDYLAKSYRPYQDRNNKLAATYDGARGQAAQVQLGLAAVQNGTTSSPTALADAGNKSEQAQGTVLDGVGVSIIDVIAQAVKDGVAPLMTTIAETQTKHSEHIKLMVETNEKNHKENKGMIEKAIKDNEDKRQQDRKENEDKRQQERKENEANIKEMIDNIRKEDEEKRAKERKEDEEKRAKERKEDKEKFDKMLKEYEAKLWKRRIVLGAECEQEKEAKR